MCPQRCSHQWEEYYFTNVREKAHLEELGKKLYIKIIEVIVAEVNEITEEDCIQYIYDVVIHRTFDGYTTEIKTIYEQLEHQLHLKIHPAPDEWDRLFNVDFFIEIQGSYIGLQIKPVSSVSHIPQIYKERDLQQKTHQQFTQQYGGKVFYVFSIKEGRTKKIANPEVLEDIQAEIRRIAHIS
jgi:hypothetical protein